MRMRIMLCMRESDKNRKRRRFTTGRKEGLGGVTLIIVRMMMMIRKQSESELPD
jgi:hypothetical protein